MRRCPEIELLIITSEQWRAMPDEDFERNWSAFERAMRDYREKNADWRKQNIRCVPCMSVA